MSEPVDIARPVAEICKRFGIDPSYVAEIDIKPDAVEVVLFSGKEGRCQGPKYIADDGNAAQETVSFKVRT